jgi:hypothetical protein
MVMWRIQYVKIVVDYYKSLFGFEEKLDTDLG